MAYYDKQCIVGLTENKTASGWRRKLLFWYDENHRDLPWRKEKDPYRIWLSEVMLQQTRVETVLPYYSRFLDSYPTLPDLSAAREDHVLKLWEGLGYYSRARNFLQAVREVNHKHGGNVPDNPDEFGGLAGVGDYTRAAVLSIAFQKPLAAVDGNVRRVLCRVFAIDKDPTKGRTIKELQTLAQALLDENRPGDYNQAVMELGALICVPGSPKCVECPVRQFCTAFAKGIAGELPRKKKKKQIPTKKYTAVVLGYRGRYLVRKRSQKLLNGLWEFPNLESSSNVLNQINELLQADIQYDGDILPLVHVFSHMRWEISVCFARTDSYLHPQGTGWSWANTHELQKMAFPAVYHPVVQKLIRGQV